MKKLSSLTYPALALFVLACSALTPKVKAACQEGCDLPKFNTFLGADALLHNTSGTDNTATGAGALTSNTTGFNNTANGVSALFYNTTGRSNTANGASALFLNTSGNYNTGLGSAALVNNTIGSNNTAVGFQALFANIGSNNTAVGYGAGANLTTSVNNIALGFLAGAALQGDNNIAIGNQGAIETGVIRIGTEGTQTATYIAGIRQTPLAQGLALAVGITEDGQLGVRSSSARFKKAIKPIDMASEAVLALKPVTFRYKNDPAALPQFGLVAEEVARVNPDLVARDKEGKPFTVRYDEINTMLLNEFLKEHKKVEEQESAIAEQRKQISDLTASLQAVNERIDAMAAAGRHSANE